MTVLPLARYPRTRVPAEAVPQAVVQVFAAVFPDWDAARGALQDAVAARHAADADATSIAQGALPTFDVVGALRWWRKALDEGRLHGARMVAALVAQLPLDRLDDSDRAVVCRLEVLLRDPRAVPAAPPAYGLVMNGGGVKGIAFVGALRELEARVDVRFSAFCGTSAGAIGAAMLAMGHDLDTLEHVMCNQPFSSFLDGAWEPEREVPPWQIPKEKAAARLSLRKVWRLAVAPLRMLRFVGPNARGALYSSAPVGRFLQYLHEWRPIRGARRVLRDDLAAGSFGECSSKLMIVASSTGPARERVYQADSDLLDEAVRASMAIPGFFERRTEGAAVLYDGGLVANFAFVKFSERFPGHRPLGLYLRDGSDWNRPGDDVPTAWNLARHVFRIFFGQDEGRILEQNRDKIVRIDIAPIQTVDFALTVEDKQFLIDAGRVGVIRFLLEETHGLPVKPGMLPTRDDLVVAADRLRASRAAAEARWRLIHGLQRAMVSMTPLILGALALIGVVAVAALAIYGVTLLRVA